MQSDCHYGHTHTRPSVPCPSTFDLQSLTSMSAAHAQAQSAYSCEHAGTMWTWSIIMVITPPCIIKKSRNLRGPSIAKTACYDMMTYVQEWPEQCECRAGGDWGGGTTVLWPCPEQLGQVWVRRNSTRFLTTSSHGGQVINMSFEHDMTFVQISVWYIAYDTYVKAYLWFAENVVCTLKFGLE